MVFPEFFLAGRPPTPPRQGKRRRSGFARRDKLQKLLVSDSPARFQSASHASGKCHLSLHTTERVVYSAQRSFTNLLEPLDNIERVIAHRQPSRKRAGYV